MRSIAIGCTLVLLVGATIAGSQDSKVATDTVVKSDNGKVITLIGCIEIGGGTSFTLTNITSEREASSPKTSPAASYALLERKGLDLGPYIQQKVELTGVVVPAATSRDRDDKIKVKEPAAAEKTVKVARGASAQLLVASVKTLSATCAGQE